MQALLREYIRKHIVGILVEGRLEDAKKKYAGRIDDQTFQLLVANDPSGNHKYLDWACREIAKGASVDTVIRIFNEWQSIGNNLPERNIYKFSANEAEDALSSYKLQRTDKRKSKYESIPGATIAQETDNYLVYHIETPEASSSLSSGTQWCISKPSTFESYQKDGASIHICIPKKSNLQKFAFVSNGQCYFAPFVGTMSGGRDIFDQSDEITMTFELPEELKAAFESVTGPDHKKFQEILSRYPALASQHLIPLPSPPGSTMNLIEDPITVLDSKQIRELLKIWSEAASVKGENEQMKLYTDEYKCAEAAGNSLAKLFKRFVSRFNVEELNSSLVDSDEPAGVLWKIVKEKNNILRSENCAQFDKNVATWHVIGLHSFHIPLLVRNRSRR